ncbi:MAG: glycerophosphodiester phosphodiesterase family protein [Spirochaetes bacterium]|nr:glycerophosphodiester phosphodiesterase family protein [Spirochaetota bacterium]
MNRNIPFILGHRGIPGLSFENTVPSFLKIKENKIDGTEFDVLLTHDGIPVVYHDFSLKRFTGKSIKIEEIDYEDLKKIELIDFDKKITYIPTIYEVIEILKDCNLINIEIKEERRNDERTENKVIEVIKKYKIEDRVVVSSFNPFVIYRLKNKAPWLKRGLLVSKIGTPFYIKKMYFLKYASPDYIHFDIRMLHDPVLDKLFNKNYKFVFWCVDNLNELCLAMKYNPIFIISNIPHNIKNYFYK